MESDYEVTLKRVSRMVGIVILAISAYLSYDGFDQSVTGGNPTYTTLGKIIGISMCVAISIIQFVLSSRYDQLNLTLKVIGFASYAYSIYTNYLGAVHILGMSTEIALAASFFLDVVPEPLIAWSFGDALKGDLFGNAMKWIFGTGSNRQRSPERSPDRPFGKPKERVGGGFGGGRPANEPNTRPVGFRPVKPEFHGKIGKK